MTSIRPYAASDLQACRDLWRDLTQAHREIYADPSIGGEDPGVHFDRHLADPRLLGLWVAESGTAVPGMIGLMKDGEDTVIEPIVVAQGVRFRGIGHDLLEFVIDIARARGDRYLSVRPVARNVQAIACFHSAGFRLLGHLDMFCDLAPTGTTSWMPGITIHGRRFRY